MELGLKTNEFGEYTFWGRGTISDCVHDPACAQYLSNNYPTSYSTNTTLIVCMVINSERAEINIIFLIIKIFVVAQPEFLASFRMGLFLYLVAKRMDK